MILDFIVINLLEETMIYFFIAYLMNRKHLLFRDYKRVLIGVVTILFTTSMVFVFRKVPGIPLMQYRIPITIIIFIIIYMIALKLNWLQSLVGLFIIFIFISIIDSLSLIFFKVFDIPFSDETLTVNSQTLPTMILCRTLLLLTLAIIIKFNIVIRIPDRFEFSKTIFKLMGSILLLFFLVFGFAWEVYTNEQPIRVWYILAIAIAGSVLGYINVRFVLTESLRIKELKKSHNRIKTSEICDEVASRKHKKT